MKQVEFYRWRIPQKPPKKPRLTSYYMNLDEGRARHPEGEPALETMELRSVYEPGEAGLGTSCQMMPGSPAWRQLHGDDYGNYLRGTMQASSKLPEKD